MKKVNKKYYFLFLIPIFINILYCINNLLKDDNENKYVLLWLYILFQFTFLLILYLNYGKIVNFIKSLDKKIILLFWFIYVLLIIKFPIINNISSILLILIYILNFWFVNEISSKIFNKIIKFIIFIIQLLIMFETLFLLLFRYSFKPETYVSLWNYNIQYIPWFQDGSSFNVCYRDKKICFNWKILWLKENQNTVYIYYDLYYSQSSLWLKEGISYIILTENEINFYLENEMETLPQKQQEIFQELKENLSIVINWVEYK
jgi:hypothetical protein